MIDRDEAEEETERQQLKKINIMSPILRDHSSFFKLMTTIVIMFPMKANQFTTVLEHKTTFCIVERRQMNRALEVEQLLTENQRCGEKTT